MKKYIYIHFNKISNLLFYKQTSRTGIISRLFKKYQSHFEFGSNSLKKISNVIWTEYRLKCN